MLSFGGAVENFEDKVIQKLDFIYGFVLVLCLIVIVLVVVHRKTLLPTVFGAIASGASSAASATSYFGVGSWGAGNQLDKVVFDSANMGGGSNLPYVYGSQGQAGSRSGFINQRGDGVDPLASSAVLDYYSEQMGAGTKEVEDAPVGGSVITPTKSYMTDAQLRSLSR